jgi:hypothetical protein
MAILGGIEPKPVSSLRHLRTVLFEHLLDAGQSDAKERI